MKKPLLSPYHVVVENGKKVLVSCCKRIIEYSPEKIEVKLSETYVSICGKDLTLCDFFGDEIQINGRIYSIAFKGERNEE